MIAIREDGMGIGPYATAIRHLRQAFDGGAVAGLSDGQLLERFVGRAGDDAGAAAFAALVGRHGPTVWNVCRSALRDEHEAEDAFQAVFLVLVRKAKALWVRDSLGPWLHAVAVRTSARSRAASARRRAREGRLAEGSRAATDGPPPHRDALALIHEEIDRLPGRYRAAVVLCDLEGLSHAQAAGRLGLPIGTVKSRQSRGRERLRGRLLRRGFVPAAVLSALSGPGPSLASAAPPASLVGSTVEAARLAAGGRVAAVPKAAGPPRGAIRAARAGVAAVALAATAASLATALGLAPTSPALRRPDPTPRAGADGGAFQVRIAADSAHDAEAIRRFLGPDGQADPPAGYAWFPWRDDLAADDPAGLVLRVPDGLTGEDLAKPTTKLLLVRTSPDDPVERDLIDARSLGVGPSGGPYAFRLAPGAARRYGARVRERLAADGGTSPSRLAIVLDGRVASTPRLPTSPGDVVSIEEGPETDSYWVPYKALAVVAARNTGKVRRREVVDPDLFAARSEARPRAREGSTPEQMIEAERLALAAADRVVVDLEGGERPIVIDRPEDIRALAEGLRTTTAPFRAEGGTTAVRFYRGATAYRTVRIDRGGRWLSRSWTVMRDGPCRVNAIVPILARYGLRRPYPTEPGPGDTPPLWVEDADVGPRGPTGGG